MKGRKPKFPEMKLLAGNPGRRPIGADSTAPFLAAPLEQPEGLDTYGAQEWARLVSTLAPILSPAAAGVVFVAVDAYSEWRRACDLIREHGETYITVSREGQEFVRQRPEVTIRANARRAYFQALGELGSTPASHSRVKPLPNENQQDLPGMHRLLG